MIYVIDIKTKEVIAEVMGSIKDVTDSLINERKRRGMNVAAQAKGSGYLITQTHADGRIEPLLEVRIRRPVKVEEVLLKYIVLTLAIGISVFLNVSLQLFAKGMGESKLDYEIDLTKLGLVQSLLSRLE